MRKLFTSESVTEGHPDKICDQVSDAVLDAIIGQDPQARVACETAITTGMVMVMGEITSGSKVNISKIVREAIREIGYDNSEYGFDCNTCSVITLIDEQSGDIAMGVNKNIELSYENQDEAIGAGDQGMMFGFASNETDEYMPAPIAMAHKLAKRLTDVRKLGILPYLRPDGKTQVTVEYEDNIPVRIEAIVISAQHSPDVKQEKLKKDILEDVIKVVVPDNLIDKNTKYYINPTGRFVIGGPQGDSGLTGRKIIVDTYGGYGRHGGGAFSGKDPTKVDRSAAYAARWIAKNLVAAGIAEKLEIEIAYAIGVTRPVSMAVDTFSTGKISDNEIIDIINNVFDLRPSSIIRELDLLRPIYRQVAAYGHFGRTDINLPWEQLNKVDEISEYIARDRIKKILLSGLRGKSVQVQLY